jgi:hypothetical protein
MKRPGEGKKYNAIRRILFISQLCLLPWHATAQYDFEGDQAEALKGSVDYMRTSHPNDTYVPLSIEELITHLPPDFIELKALLEVRQQLPELKENYGEQLDSIIASTDRQIDSLKNHIIERRIRPSYEVLHFYAFKRGKSYNVYGHVFYLNHAFKVIRMRTYVEVTMEKNDYEWFEFWQMEEPMFNMSNVNRNQEASSDVYTFLRKGMEHSEHRSEYIFNALTLVKTVTRSGVFDIHEVSHEIIKNYLQRNSLDATLRITQFSPVFEIQAGEQKNYRVYATAFNKTSEQTINLIFEFNVFHELLDMKQTDEDVSKYFQN